MWMQQARTVDIPDVNHFKDYVPTEGTIIFLLIGSRRMTSQFDALPVSRLEVAPFRAGLQAGSSPSEYFESFLLLTSPWLSDI